MTEDDSIDLFARTGYKSSTLFETIAWTGVAIEIGAT